MLHHLPPGPPGRAPDPDDGEAHDPVIVPPQSARARAARARAARAHVAAQPVSADDAGPIESRSHDPGTDDTVVSQQRPPPTPTWSLARVREQLAAADLAVVPPLQRGFRAALDRMSSLSAKLMAAEARVGGGRPLSFGQRNARLLAPAVGLLLLAGAAVHMDRYGDVRQDAGARQEITEAGGAGGGGLTLAGGEAVEIGPERGEDLGRYIAERERVLAGLAPDAVHVAVVSFTDTLGASELEAVLEDAVVHSIQFTNPVEPERPLSSSVVGSIASTIENAVASTRSMAEEERRQVQLLIDDGNVGDPAFLEEYERRVEQMDDVLAVLDSEPAIVFAAVVEARVDDLRAMADDANVRLVDPAPPETSVDDSGFWGLLPADTDTATFGRG